MPEKRPVLLAIPDTESRQLLKKILTDTGFEQIIEAEDGRGAVAILRARTIDALITDIPLEGLDGWRLARLVRSGVFATPSNVPIIVVTRSYSDRIAEVTAKEYEIDAFIPFRQRNALAETLRALLLRETQGTEQPRLLVVEDNPDTTLIVKRVLEKRFDIETAANGKAGLEAWKARRHALVLLDVMLPEMSGPEVLRKILAISPTQSVVIMTADGTPERAGELVLEGAADFIAKPFRAEQLRRVCDIALRREDYMLSNEQFAQQLNDLNLEKERALVTLESIGDGVITTDTAGRVEYLNPVAEQLTGWTNHAARGENIEDVFHLVNEFTRNPVENPIKQCLDLSRTVDLGSHNLLIHRNGTEIAVDDTVTPIVNREGSDIGAVMVFHDVTEARQLTRKLSYQATHDNLTGLINRSEFERRMSRLLDDARQNGSEHVICYIDLDQFKVVNDTCGHMAGDQLLRQLAAVFRKHIRQRDTLARLGGDEFGVLLEYCGLEKAREVADEIRDAAQKLRFTWEDKLFSIGTSIGVVPITAESPSLENILSRADAACYLAKERGRNRVHIYRSDDGEMVQHYGEMQWVSKVTRAFEEERFRLYFQSLVPVDKNTQEGEHYEILLRMIDEKGDLVPPGLFLPAVERFDLSATIDRWVTRTTLDWLQNNPARLDALFQCAINLSAKTLGDDYFHDFVKDRFAETGVPPEKICFEITETAAIANLGKASDLILALKSLGCRFALDDFGSGMSSFAYLKTLPVDYLKIDGVFVKDMVDDPIDRAMVHSINEIGHVIGLKTIAEFVENDAILAMLGEVGVDYAQGYGIAVPRPLAELEK